MNRPSAPTLVLNLPVPTKSPERLIEAMLTASPQAFLGVYEGTRERGDPDRIEEAIKQAECFMANAASAAAELRDAVAVETVEEIRRQLSAFVMAWPNASNADLAGYGLQLIADIVEQQPCRYAVREALRQLRHTSRFLPSIAEVLTELDKAQNRIRNTAWHIGQIPAEIERARADLEGARAREVRAVALMPAVGRVRTTTALVSHQEPAP